MVKRVLWFSLLLLLLFGSAALADTGDLAIDGDFTAIAAQGNTVYLLDEENNLFIVQAGQSFPEAPACTLSRKTDFLLVDQGFLYGWEPISGALFRIDEATGAATDERFVGGADPDSIRDGFTKYDDYAPLLHDGTLTVYWEGPYNYQGLIQYAPDGAYTSYDLEGDGTLIHGAPDGRIIAVPDWCGDKWIGQLDVEKGDFEWSHRVSLDTWGIAVHGEKVYVGAGNYIEQYGSLESTDGQVAACLPQTGISLRGQSMKILDGEWAALIIDGTFYLRRLDTQRSTRELTLPVELYNTWDKNASFLAENPNVALRFADWWMMSPYTGEEYQEAIERLEADILSCDISRSPWQMLKDEGYAADLSASGLLQLAVAGIYPAFRDTCMRDGHVVALPLSSKVDWTMRQIDKKMLMEKTGLAGDQLPKTFLELPDFFSRWLEETDQISPDDDSLNKLAAHRLCEMFMEHYVAYYEGHGEPLVFDTPLFRAGLALRDQIPLLPSVSEANKGGWNGIIFHSRESFSANQSLEILPLALDSKHPYTLPVTMSLLFVNPKSTNIDLAIAYLESAVLNMPPEKQVLWTAGDWEPVPNTEYKTTLAEYTEELTLLHAKAEAFADDSWFEFALSWAEDDSASFAQNGQWLVSPEFLQAYSAIAEHMVVYEQDFFDEIRLREQYLNRQIDADELILRLQHLADQRQAAEE